MEMYAQYLKNKKLWSAYMTVNGVDIQEYGNTEKDARRKLADRIASSKFLLAGIKQPK